MAVVDMSNVICGCLYLVNTGFNSVCTYVCVCVRLCARVWVCVCTFVENLSLAYV